jgi:hypothetical protein
MAPRYPLPDFLSRMSPTSIFSRVSRCIVATNPAVPGNDFRYYLDLNENGRFDTNYFGQDLDGFGNILPGAPYLHTGDPEWVGVLEHPDAPHGPNNHFISRYAFAAVPSGNTLDLNYIYNQARNLTYQPNTPFPPTALDGYMRNQGVGAWEINLAAFLADLNTNIWGQFVGSGASAPFGSATYYQYNEPFANNSGYAFQDAFSLLKYRYNYSTLPSAGSVLFWAPLVFPYDGMDAFSDGPLQTTLDTNEDLFAFGTDGDIIPKGKSWSGADNPNHFFSIGDLLDPSKIPNIPNSFIGHLTNAGGAADTYDRYTYYRMLAQLGTDSSPEDGKLNLNYSNAVVSYYPNGTVQSVGVVIGAETNLVPWTPQNFFNAAADQMLRLYTAEWFQSNPSNFLATYYAYLPQGYLDSTGLGVTNFPNFGQTNQIPAFGITNIPVMVNGNFVYSPAVNRLLQLAANLYDASTNNNQNLPHVFRPLFRRDSVGNIFIASYTNLYSSKGPNTVSGPADLQLGTPWDASWLSGFPLHGLLPNNTPMASNGVPINIYGVPWIIGAKQGLPGFEQLYLTNTVQVARKLLFSRPYVGAPLSKFTTNQMFDMAFYTGVGVSFWNSYTNTYVPHNGGQLTVVANDTIYSGLSATNASGTVFGSGNIANYYLGANSNGITLNSWPGSIWSGSVPNRQVANSGIGLNSAFVNGSWLLNFPLSPAVYRFQNPSLGAPGFDPIGSPTSFTWETTTPPLPQLPNFALGTTNYLQAYILDGNNVIDYVQFRDPTTTTNLGPVIADPNYINYPDHNTKSVISGAPMVIRHPTPVYPMGFIINSSSRKIPSTHRRQVNGLIPPDSSRQAC